MHLTPEDIRELRHEPGALANLIRQSSTNTRSENTRRRALILRHPDLAERLTQPPLRHTTPEHWTGYIPPEQWGGRHNDAPERPALIALVEEAERRNHHGASHA